MAAVGASRSSDKPKGKPTSESLVIDSVAAYADSEGGPSLDVEIARFGAEIRMVARFGDRPARRVMLPPDFLEELYSTAHDLHIPAIAHKGWMISGGTRIELRSGGASAAYSWNASPPPEWAAIGEIASRVLGLGWRAAYLSEGAEVTEGEDAPSRFGHSMGQS